MSKRFELLLILVLFLLLILYAIDKKNSSLQITLTLDSNPKNAWVYIDGVNTSLQTKNKFVLYKGIEHEITLVKPGYYNYSFKTVLYSDNEFNILLDSSQKSNYMAYKNSKKVTIKEPGIGDRQNYVIDYLLFHGGLVHDDGRDVRVVDEFGNEIPSQTKANSMSSLLLSNDTHLEILWMTDIKKNQIKNFTIYYNFPEAKIKTYRTFSDLKFNYLENSDDKFVNSIYYIENRMYKYIINTSIAPSLTNIFIKKFNDSFDFVGRALWGNSNSFGTDDITIAAYGYDWEAQDFPPHEIYDNIKNEAGLNITVKEIGCIRSVIEINTEYVHNGNENIDQKLRIPISRRYYFFSNSSYIFETLEWQNPMNYSLLYVKYETLLNNIFNIYYIYDSSINDIVSSNFTNKDVVYSDHEGWSIVCTSGNKKICLIMIVHPHPPEIGFLGNLTGKMGKIYGSKWIDMYAKVYKPKKLNFWKIWSLNSNLSENIRIINTFRSGVSILK